MITLSEKNSKTKVLIGFRQQDKMNKNDKSLLNIQTITKAHVHLW